MAGQHDDRRLEAVLAQDAHRLAAIDVGQPDIHDHQVDLAGLGLGHALGAGIDRDRLEFVVQGELLDQGGPQFRVIVDDQDFAAVGHRFPGPPRHIGHSPAALREVEHSG